MGWANVAVAGLFPLYGGLASAGQPWHPRVPTMCKCLYHNLGNFKKRHKLQVQAFAGPSWESTLLSAPAFSGGSECRASDSSGDERLDMKEVTQEGWWDHEDRRNPRAFKKEGRTLWRFGVWPSSRPITCVCEKGPQMSDAEVPET
jgi:hypothetical protein